MSGYYDDEPPRRPKSTRSSRRPVYEEEVVEQRSSRPSRQMELVRRPRDDSSDSVEEIQRDLPRASTYVKRRSVVRDAYPPRARSADRRGSYEESYTSRRSRRQGDRSSRRARYESDSESSRSPPPRHRRKSISEKAIAALGLGGAAAAVANKGDHQRSHGRHDRRESRSRSPSGDRATKIQQSIKAAVTAGAIEAFRSRKEPGGWQGQGKRVITAAIGAAGISGAITGSKDNPEHHSTRHTIESAIGGLASNRLVNGARSRSRSRSRARGGRGPEQNGLGAGGIAAATGLAALAGKALNDYRERKKDDDGGRGRRRGSGYYDDSDSRSPSPNRKRSKSVSEYMTRGMAALGLRDGRGGDDRGSSRRDGGDQGYQPRPRGGGGDDVDAPRAHSPGTDTDHYSSSEEEHKRRKMRSKEFITAGLATVATIHAGHSVYQSIEKREKRQKELAAGTISPEEARRRKSRALLQDAASVGIAALGIKGAVSEWKEMKEQRHECHEATKRLEEKREHRRLKERGLYDGSSKGSSSGGGNGSSKGGNRNSEPNMNQRYRSDDRIEYSSGPRYDSGNPYVYAPYSAGLPPPPMGSQRMRY